MDMKISIKIINLKKRKQKRKKNILNKKEEYTATQKKLISLPPTKPSALYVLGVLNPNMRSASLYHITLKVISKSNHL